MQAQTNDGPRCLGAQAHTQSGEHTRRAVAPTARAELAEGATLEKCSRATGNGRPTERHGAATTRQRHDLELHYSHRKRGDRRRLRAARRRGGHAKVRLGGLGYGQPAGVAAEAVNTAAGARMHHRWRHASPDHVAEAEGTPGDAGSTAHAPADDRSSARSAARRGRSATDIVCGCNGAAESVRDTAAATGVRGEFKYWQ